MDERTWLAISGYKLRQFKIPEEAIRNWRGPLHPSKSQANLPKSTLIDTEN